MAERFDAVVVGAGPAGLAAALFAQRHGRSVALLAPGRPGDERTTALLAGSVALFERLGVWPRLAAAAAPLRAIRLVDVTRRLIRAPEVLFEAEEIGLDAFGYNIPNRDLADALEAAVGETAIRRFADVASGLRAGVGEVTVTTGTGAAVAARLAIAADGRRSVLREAAGIAVRNWRYPQAALVLNFRHGLPHEDTSTEFHGEAGPLAVVPLPGGTRSSLVWVERPGEVARLAALDDAALAEAIEARSQSLLGAVTLDGPRQVFPLSGMTAARFAAGRVALVGEAAHVFPPIGAQGLNLGLRDVAGLAVLLEPRHADPGSPERLALYHRRRQADILSRTAAVDALNRSLLSGFLPVQGLRGLALLALDRVRPLRRAVMRQGLAALRPG
jgi:2-octaprenyl-6-methoxyphenol hydroxylase